MPASPPHRTSIGADSDRDILDFVPGLVAARVAGVKPRPKELVGIESAVVVPVAHDYAVSRGTGALTTPRCASVEAARCSRTGRCGFGTCSAAAGCADVG